MKFKSNILPILTVLFNIAIFYSLNGQSKIDSLKLQLENTSNQEIRLATLQSIIQELGHTDFDEAFRYARQAVAEAEAANHPKFLPIFYEGLGRKFANSQSLDSAGIFFHKAVKGYEQIDNQHGIATTYFKLAWLARSKADFEKAMNYDLDAMRIMEKLDDATGMASAYSRISDDLYYQENPEESLKYALKGIELGKKRDIGNELIYCYTAAGSAHHFLDEMEEALKYYDLAYDVAKKKNLQSDLFSITNSQGNALKYMEEYEKALAKYQESIAIIDALGIGIGFRSAPISNIAHVYLLQKKYKQALPYQLETVAIQESIQSTQNLQEGYLHTSKIYENLGDFEKALFYQKKYRTLRDSVLNVTKDKSISDLRIQYETEKKEEKINEQNTLIAHQQNIQYLSYAIGALLLSLLGGIFIAYRNNRKKKDLLETLNKALDTSNQELDKKNTQNELLLKEIHHRVKNNLEVISGLLELQSAQVNDASSQKVLQASQSRVQSMGIIHQKLYQGTNLTSIEMRDYFSNLGDSILDTFDAFDKIALHVEMNQLELDIEQAIPIGLIVNELVTNACKYAFPNQDDQKGNITISLSRDKQFLTLTVSDDGIGKIQNDSAQGTGFGSQLIHLLTRQLDGKMEEAVKDGTIYTFHFKSLHRPIES